MIRDYLGRTRQHYRYLRREGFPTGAAFVMAVPPTRARAAWAALRGHPVAYRLRIGEQGAALYFPAGTQGAIVAECVIDASAFRAPGVDAVSAPASRRSRKVTHDPP